MLVVKRLNNFGIRHPGSVAALGSFDGLHRGHLAIIRRLVKRGRETGHDSVVITFDPHPRQVLCRNGGPFLLTTLTEKMELLEALGVGAVAVVRFSPRVAALPPGDFIRRVLVEKLAVSEVICGPDFGFGAGRSGGRDTLAEAGRRWGFRVAAPSLVRSGGIKVGSSLIRELISSGKLERAGLLLGRPYCLRGRVVRGLGLGRKLGFPTANIKVDDPRKLLPRDGVYAASGRIGGRRHLGMAFIGSRLTLGRAGRTVEFNAFGGRHDFAGKQAELCFHRFLRPGRRFSGLGELARAIACDQRRVERFFRTGRAGGLPAGRKSE
jgi:riboflavin kinase/FMN adenylyltransferase